MFGIQYYRQIFKLLLAVNLVFISFTPVTAQKSNNQSQPNKKQPKKSQPQQNRRRKPRKNFVYFRQPQRQGTPLGTRPAGSRKSCPISEKEQLRALVPVTKETSGRELHWGLTTKANPSFWFYVPHKLSSIKNAKFSLRNRKNKTIYEKELQLTNTPGIIQVSVPDNAISLKVGEWYQYYLFMDIDCSPKGIYRKEFAQAWVKREAIASGFEARLQRIPLRQRGLFYAQNGIWYDAMVSFAKLKYEPGTSTEWKQMLESAGLGQFSQVRLIDCCE